MSQLLVGENSFISLEEANSIIADNYMSTSNEATWWSGLSDSDKSVVIISATNKLNNEQCRWIGQRVNDNQSLSFPRINKRNGAVYDIDSIFKLGIVELAINDNKPSFSNFDMLTKSGVTSFSDGGGMSVKFSDNIVSRNTGENNNLRIPNELFKTYFMKYSLLVMWGATYGC